MKLFAARPPTSWICYLMLGISEMMRIRYRESATPIKGFFGSRRMSSSVWLAPPTTDPRACISSLWVTATGSEWCCTTSHKLPGWLRLGTFNTSFDIFALLWFNTPTRFCSKPSSINDAAIFSSLNLSAPMMLFRSRIEFYYFHRMMYQQNPFMWDVIQQGLNDVFLHSLYKIINDMQPLRM
jgi:hypothetical protein